MNPKHKKIASLFFEDLTLLFAVVPIGIIICPFIIAGKYSLEWLWIVAILIAIYFIAISTTKRFKLWQSCRLDIKENRIVKKEILIEEFELDHNSHATHRASTHNILEDFITDVLLGWTENVLKTIGGDKKYTLTDTENNTYHLTNFYKTKTRKKDLKKPLAYNALKGRTVEIEYLENSKLILSITMDKATQNSKLIGGFWEIFSGYMV